MPSYRNVNSSSRKSGWKALLAPRETRNGMNSQGLGKAATTSVQREQEPYGWEDDLRVKRQAHCYRDGE